MDSSTECFTGEVQLFAFPYAPSGWLPCDGRIVPMHQYGMLFSVIGNAYGGDGKDTFALPKLPPLGPKGPHYYICMEGSDYPVNPER